MWWFFLLTSFLLRISAFNLFGESLAVSQSSKKNFFNLQSRFHKFHKLYCPAIKVETMLSASSESAFEIQTGQIVIDRPKALDNSHPFVFETMTNRVPVKIISRTVDYNKGTLPQHLLDQIGAVGAEMLSNSKISKLCDCPDVELWNEILEPYIAKGACWADLPWYISETYVYQRLLEASGYWDSESPGFQIDIFGPEKRESLQLSLKQVQARMEVCMQASGAWSLRHFTTLMHMSLWGNQGDSSLFTVHDIAKMGSGAGSGAGLVVDAAEDTFALLDRSPAATVGVVTDNAGMELASDLALAHYLLSLGPERVAAVDLHLKPQPFFVSDAGLPDVAYTLAVLRRSPHPASRSVAQDLDGLVASGRLRLLAHGPVSRAAVSPQAFWDMPQPARAVLGQTSLAVIKGDLMYRKLLGDRPFPPETPFSRIAAYFPCPVVALRTCKSPLAVGLRPGQAEQLAASTPNWMVEGKCGMVQLACPAPADAVDIDHNRPRIIA